jgi:hypothetical protein
MLVHYTLHTTDRTGLARRVEGRLQFYILRAVYRMLDVSAVGSYKGPAINQAGTHGYFDRQRPTSSPYRARHW